MMVTVTNSAVLVSMPSLTVNENVSVAAPAPSVAYPAVARLSFPNSSANERLAPRTSDVAETNWKLRRSPSTGSVPVRAI